MIYHNKLLFKTKQKKFPVNETNVYFQCHKNYNYICLPKAIIIIKCGIMKYYNIKYFVI